MNTLLFASQNENKIAEISAVLPINFHIIGLKEAGFDHDIPETGHTLEENALIKARYLFEKTGKDCFADDSGLEVEALNGAPGVYSARYAGKHGDAEANMDKLLNELKGQLNRKAKFVTVIALIINGKEHLFKGEVLGTILEEKRGEKGFGYDPLFLPDGFFKTFAEMELVEKKAISHRSRAIAKMMSFLNSV